MHHILTLSDGYYYIHYYYASWPNWNKMQKLITTKMMIIIILSPNHWGFQHHQHIQSTGLYLLFIPGWVLIDRCGKHFGTILSFLRDDSVPLPETKRELMELLKEAKYYLIQELVNFIEGQQKQIDLEPICRVPLVTSLKEEQALIASTSKVTLIWGRELWACWGEVYLGA